MWWFSKIKPHLEVRLCSADSRWWKEWKPREGTTKSPPACLSSSGVGRGWWEILMWRNMSTNKYKLSTSRWLLHRLTDVKDPNSVWPLAALQSVLSAHIQAASLKTGDWLLIGRLRPPLVIPVSPRPVRVCRTSLDQLLPVWDSQSLQAHGGSAAAQFPQRTTTLTP